jgi:glutamate transport system permease protein
MISHDSGNFAYLYDLPGPRGRRRIAIGSWLSTLVLLVVIGLGVWQFADHGQLDADRWTPFLQGPIWQYLLVGFLGTLQAAALTVVLAAPLGALLAVGRLSQVRVVRWLATAFIEIARTVPVLLLIYLMLFGLPHYGINLPVLWKLVIPLTVANSAVFAEIIRAAASRRRLLASSLAYLKILRLGTSSPSQSCSTGVRCCPPSITCSSKLSWS